MRKQHKEVGVRSNDEPIAELASAKRRSQVRTRKIKTNRPPRHTSKQCCRSDAPLLVRLRVNAFTLPIGAIRLPVVRGCHDAVHASRAPPPGPEITSTINITETRIASRLAGNYTANHLASIAIRMPYNVNLEKRRNYHAEILIPVFAITSRYKLLYAKWPIPESKICKVN
ncbi:hypothetical protein BCR43DRAFT_519475 [Syncephalastrum racemosum]|uniref:Uncharacterized protein n=1 Tax=Syncephalastrum racemosum TaxID=13706 RepID=A0A1X2GYZ9_SYNRA|nr:hypothetical protein BCR43DRAFT_519475 [Syncephalastrum racemosum]